MHIVLGIKLISCKLLAAKAPNTNCFTFNYFAVSARFYLFTYFWGGVVPIRFCITVITSAAWSSVLFLVDAVALVFCGFDEATEVLPWALNVEDAAVELYIRCKYDCMTWRTRVQTCLKHRCQSQVICLLFI